MSKVKANSSSINIGLVGKRPARHCRRFVANAGGHLHAVPQDAQLSLERHRSHVPDSAPDVHDAVQRGLDGCGLGGRAYPRSGLSGSRLLQGICRADQHQGQRWRAQRERNDQATCRSARKRWCALHAKCCQSPRRRATSRRLICFLRAWKCTRRMRGCCAACWKSDALAGACQIIQHDARIHRRTKPVVVQKRLEACVALTAADERVVVSGDASRSQQAEIIGHSQIQRVPD